MRPVDRLLLAFLALLGVAAAVYVPDPWPSVGAVAAMAGAIVAAAYLSHRAQRVAVLHAFLPVPIMALLLNAVGPVVEHANPARWDGALADVDARLLGPLAAAWRNAGGRPVWLVDAASAAYALYYVLPVAVAAVLWLRKRDAFDRYTLAIATVLLASYASYVIAPASGPRAQAFHDGGPISAGLRVFLGACERNLLDAFPSGHTAVSLAFLCEVWRLFPRWRAPAVAAVGAIVFSTVYLSFHYVIDVFAGAGLAALVYSVSHAAGFGETRTPAAMTPLDAHR